jgi:hypothetical protein
MRVSIPTPSPDCLAKPKTCASPRPERFHIYLAVEKGFKDLRKHVVRNAPPVSLTTSPTYCPDGPEVRCQRRSQLYRLAKSSFQQKRHPGYLAVENGRSRAF